MPANRIIPSLLLRGGRLVKGVRFAEHRDAGAPATTARAHAAQGADELALIDIDAGRERRAPDFAALDALAREVQVPVTFGGGIATADLAHRAFDSGADKVCLTTTALDDPALIGAVAHRYGSQAVVVGIDAVGPEGRWQLYDHRSRRPVPGSSAVAWATAATAAGAGEIRLVSVDREGSREGLDIALWRAVRAAVNVPIVLEGGAGSLDDVAVAMKAGVDSVGLGTLLVFSDNNLVKVRRFLGGAGLKVRP